MVKTFDGKHRCQICVAVDAGKKSEREQQKLKSLDKADWLIPETAVTLFRPATKPATFPASSPPRFLRSRPAHATSPAGLIHLPPRHRVQ